MPLRYPQKNPSHTSRTQGRYSFSFTFVTAKNKAGIIIKIRTNFIEHPDTESTEIKFYGVGYSTGLVVYICGGSFHTTHHSVICFTVDYIFVQIVYL